VMRHLVASKGQHCLVYGDFLFWFLTHGSPIPVFEFCTEFSPFIMQLFSVLPLGRERGWSVPSFDSGFSFENWLGFSMGHSKCVTTHLSISMFTVNHPGCTANAILDQLTCSWPHTSEPSGD
jgi:hypothetical protein